MLIQAVAFAIAAVANRTLHLTETPLIAALGCGALAALFSHLAGLARWWLPIQFFFVPLMLLVLMQDIPPLVFLAGFILLLAVYWSTYRSQVPLYLSSRKVWQALETLLPQDKEQHFSFMDLGSGLGGVLTYLSRARPDGLYYGIETAPLPCLWSWLRIKLGGHDNCRVQWGSMWDCDLSRYDVVFAYLSPVPMERLWHKAQAEMRPGSVFISSTFQVPGKQPDFALDVDDLHHSRLLVWKIK